MRTYYTSAARITTARREGYYPSLRTARFLAKRICYVLSRESDLDVEACAQTLYGSVTPVLQSQHESGGTVTRYVTPLELRSWSPADYQAVRQFSTWWSYDAEGLTDDGFSEDARDAFLGGAYVLVDLNTGRSLVVVDR